MRAVSSSSRVHSEIDNSHFHLCKSCHLSTCCALSPTNKTTQQYKYRQLDLLESLTNKETPSQREIWKRKILELREDATSIRRQGEHYDRMVSAGIRQRRERDELLARRRRNRSNNGEGNADEMQQLAEEADSLASSTGMVNELLMSGQASLSSLVGQRQRMRWINRKMLDMGNKLGLSNSTMRMIERRDATDAYLVFGGMVVTLLVIYFLYF